MQEDNPKVYSAEIEPQRFLEAQFVALRAEIIETKSRNFQIIGLGVASLPVGNFVANKFASAVHIALPAVVIVVALLYLGSNNAIIRCGTYIRDHIEPSTVIGWEQWLEKMKDARDSDQTVSVAIRLLFTIYLIIALVLAWQELERVLVPGAAVTLTVAYISICAWFAYRFVSSFLIHTPRERKGRAAQS